MHQMTRKNPNFPWVEVEFQPAYLAIYESFLVHPLAQNPLGISVFEVG